MSRASAFVPGHISGFFRVYEGSNNPQKIGSRNCGPCISNGVKTTVEVKKSSKSRLEILINDEQSKAETTKKVANQFLDQIDGEKDIIISHDVQAPIGSGFGMSGAGALGASLAISRALDMDIDEDEILSKAHGAEVVCKSGLGDVGPQKIGGLVISTEPGAPPYGKWEKIGLDPEWRVITATVGSLSTSGFLKDSDFKKKAKELGEIAMNDLIEKKSLERFMKVSKKFAVGLGVYNDDFLDILNEVSSGCPFGASAILLGKGIFAPVKSFQIEEVEDLFLDYFDSNQIMKSEIDFQGARLC